MKVIDRLKKYILVDGFHIVIDPQASQDSWIVDKETGKKYLDCYSQFSSQPFGWNYEPFMQHRHLLDELTMVKFANSDCYSEAFAGAVEVFAENLPDFQHFFFIDGGTLGIENALKAAFDWKCQIDPHHQWRDGQKLDVIHFKEAFHGRSGYTLSLTNTGESKTKWYPKFDWTRVSNPKIHFPLSKGKCENSEAMSLNEIKNTLEKGNVAAIIIEPIQSEGGNNIFRAEFLQDLKWLADHHNALLIFDEVQTGLSSGKMWCYEHYGVIPDLLVFGKKTQVCGFCSTSRIDQAPENVFKKSGRINSTWGGSLIDLVRGQIVFQVIKENNLLEHSAQMGQYFLEQLCAIESPEIDNIRGLGCLLAFDLPTPERRDEIFNKLLDNMLILKCGTKSIRLRPHLTFGKEDVDQAIEFIKKVL